ncbi:MAG: hypothetical protein V1733_01810 [bacterium]
MLVYRFKITSEEYEEFLREVVIQPSQKFLDFHMCLLESADLFLCKQASFFLTDKKYKKDKEISLHTVEKQVKRYDPELDDMVMVTLTPRRMKDSKLKDFIEDPHQRLIYEFQGKTNYTFLIELIKITDSNGEDFFPRCVKWVGELPKKPEVIIAPPVREEKKTEEIRPKLVLPDLPALSKLDGIEEDESEIAKIEGNLVDFLFGEKPEEEVPSRKKTKATADVDDEDLEESDGDTDEVEDLNEGMDHIEDYDNIDQIGMKYSGHGDGSDDE